MQHRHCIPAQVCLGVPSCEWRRTDISTVATASFFTALTAQCRGGRAREDFIARQAAQVHKVGRVGGEQDDIVAQLLPGGREQVAQVGLVRAAVAVLILNLQHTARHALVHTKLQTLYRK